MKIIVLIPSDDYRVNAGARIRYGRIAQSLASAGHQLQLEDINGFDPLVADCGVLIISKCHDARTLICAHVLGNRGCVVGVDLFDDYFSQVHDSRLTRYRDWLASLVPIIDFVLCSTPAMAEVAHLYRVDLPIHVMNDPADTLPAEELADLLERKLTAARDSRTIELCWFGMGDNPHFRVGLSDVAAFGGDLAVPVKLGFNVRLKVLTNERSLDAEGLDLLAQLPVPVTVEEWTEMGETAALAEATACILPVNAQRFSVAKSLNRAVSALSAGCQVIASGFPLYEPLAPLVYRDMESLAADLEKGTPLLRTDTRETFDALMAEWASPEHEATSLAAFLVDLVEEKAGHGSGHDLPRMAILHGSQTSGPAHKLGQRLGLLAVRSPFCLAKLSFDVFFGGRIGQPKLDMFVTERALDRLLPAARAKAKKAGVIVGQPIWSLSDRTDPSQVDWTEAPLTLQLAVYAATINDMREQIENAFGRLDMILAESSRHAFSARAM